MATRTRTPQKDNTSRKKWGSNSGKLGRGTNDRLLIGRVRIAGADRKVRSFVKFNLDSTFWDGVEVVTAATLTLTTANNTGDSELAPGSGAKVGVYRLKENFAEGSDADWASGSFAWPSPNLNLKAVAEGSASPDTTIVIDIIELLSKVAPKSVAFVIDGERTNGKNWNDRGFLLRAEPEWDKDAATEVWASEYGTASKRPILSITYEEANSAPTAGLVNPDGNVTFDFDIDGTFTDVNANDYMTRARVQIRDSGDADWTNPLYDFQRDVSVSVVDDQWHITNSDFPGGSPSRLQKGTTYELRAKVFDRANRASDWTAAQSFAIIADAPTVTADDIGSVATLDGVLLGGAYTVDSLTDALTVDVEVYSGSTLKWKHSYPITQSEKDAGRIEVEYGGPTLGAGSYTYRVRLTDTLGGQSSWSADGNFTLTQDAPDTEDSLDNITGFTDQAPTTRIKLFGMDPNNRGPKGLKAIIEDAAHLGISWYATAPGQLFFTLPVTHPQVGQCDPMVTHYQVEQYRRGRWKMLAAGLLYDFDATTDEVIFFGIDYLGLLSWSIEAATQPGTNYKKRIPTKVTGTRGSRYFNKKIRYIIRDQLRRARFQDSNSPVRFISHKDGILGDFDTKVTIYASYAQRLNFIRGLMDSHKGSITAGGGERRSRLRVRYRKDIKRWVFDALDAVGSDRDNIRLEYGSLLQGYQVIAFDDYANLVYGTGHEPNKLKPHFQTVAAPGISQSDWGSIGKAAFWGDVTDAQDLKRRARAEAIRASRVGKRIALGLRVDGLAMWDGYDILDSIPIVIDDGVVDTSDYGSGYWTIWGGEYRNYPDGHDEVTLIVRPKGDGAVIDTDLIDSDPIHAEAEWKWGSGAP